jgi:putative phosphoesterase
MKIGIISDSHRKPRRAGRAIDLLIDKGCEFFIHAGDIVEEETLKILQSTKLPYVAVFGNNDRHLRGLEKTYNLVLEPYCFELDGLRFKLMHIPVYLVPDVDVVVFGHTHTKYINHSGKALFINPGEVCARNKDISECVMLETLPYRYKTTYYYRKIKTNEWLSHTVEFEK